eukprot:TRINITY_DN19021_c0_g1_i2.p1 TRINITY_DN19021_c0_g1~~TRINITY_DN19021_c0_g1_i2.p1  ORF type:complete len:1049 (+),score=312.68 TRINITY_DN19021_c0_g1_i2:96-3149(+)
MADPPQPKRRRVAEGADWYAANGVCIDGREDAGFTPPPPLLAFDAGPFPPAALRAIAKAGFQAPTTVQSAVWPLLLDGRDVICIAQTGSGKTLGFVLPALSHVAASAAGGGEGPCCLVLAPTRELAQQTHGEARRFAAQTGKGRCRSVCLYGGADVDEQAAAAGSGCEMVVATPGRLLFLAGRGSVSLGRVTYLVLDEADRLLDMGFKHQVREAAGLCCSADRQTSLFSATWGAAVSALCDEFLRGPVMLRVGQGAGADPLVAASEVKQEVEVVPEGEKPKRLLRALSAAEVRPGGHAKAIVFVNTKRGCAEVAERLTEHFGPAGGTAVGSIHGNRTQDEREAALAAFTRGPCRCLVATDVAARGIDVDDVSLVVCYDFPEAVGAAGVEEYVHRVGRTGRAGRGGRALTFFPPGANSHELVRILRASDQPVPPELQRLDAGPVGLSARQQRKDPRALQRAQEAQRRALGQLRVAALTREISAAAQHKSLRAAKAAWAKLEEEGLTPSAYTHASMIHAYVNSGDLPGARARLQAMRAAGHAPNAVVYTTLVKGCCQAGDIEGAQQLLDAMVSETPPVIPDERAVNTFLRGCVRVGALEPACAAFARMTDEWKLTPDAVTYRCMVQLLCQGAKLDEARRLMAQGSPAALSAHGNAAALPLHLALCATLLGLSEQAASHLSMAESAAAAEAEEAHRGDRLFTALRLRDLEGEAARLSDFLASEEVLDINGALARCLLFSAQLAADNPEAAARAAALPPDQVPPLLEAALRERMGADTLVTTGSAAHQWLQARLKRSIGASGHLRWKNIFKDDPGGSQLPVKLEICSGNGDWVAAQASHEAGHVRWAAVELRHDRVYRIFTRVVLDALSNVAIIGGDAAQVLAHRIADGSVTQICVNFPEPPYHTGSEDAESQFHLLTPEFFRQMHRCVCAEGGVTIFSDSRRYCGSLARTAGELCSESGETLFASREVRRVPYETVGGVRVYRGVPGPECGHAVAAASFFDRFWEHGNQAERFYIALVKK